jgi:membrane-anchored glycerophosphoryl diester phosphodiesterase (GDPDase)
MKITQKYKNMLLAGFVMAILVSVSVVSAQSTSSFRVENPIKANNITDLIFQLADIVLMIAVPVSVLMLIYSGFLFVKARGNESEITEAKHMFFSVIVGIAVLFGARFLSEIIRGTIEQLKG